MKRAVIYISSIFLLLFATFSTSETLLNKLELADKIKSSDVKKFNSLLLDIESNESQLSNDSSSYFNLLKAYQHSYSGNIKQAQEIATALKFHNAPEHIKFRASLLLANIAGVNQNWSEGILNLNNTYRLLPTITDSILKQSYFSVAALFYNQLQQFNLGIEHAIELKKLNPVGRLKCIAEQAHVEAAMELNLLSPESYEVQAAITICQNINETLWAELIRTQISKILNKKSLYKESIKNLLPHLPEIESTAYPRLIVDAYASISYAYLMINKQDRALFYANKVLEYSDGITTTQAVITANKNLYIIYKNNGDIEKALNHYEQHANSSFTYLDEVKTKALAFQLAQHQTALQNSKINLLNKQNELLNNKNKLLQVEHTLTESEAKNNRLIAALSIAVAILVGFFGFRSWQTQKRLKLMAEYDYLTKVYNRGHFMVLAEETLKLASKSGQTVTCIIFDLDKFKKVNDTYGHHTGDWALKASVAAVKNCIREHDILARLGGEEFVVLLPSCDLQAATFVAEKCIETLQQIDTQETGHQFTITASFGITTTKLSGYNVEQLTADADTALYSSKHNGRNQLTIYDNDLTLAELV